MRKVTVYQASSRSGHLIDIADPIEETAEQAIARRTRDWPKHDPNPNNCTGHGHYKCMSQGEHSSFNHTMDSYYAHPNLSNLPDGYIED